MTALPDPQRRYCQRKQRTEANANGHDRMPTITASE